MTREEALEGFKAAMLAEILPEMTTTLGLLAENVFKLVEAGVNAEREECARIVDRDDMSAWGLARAIRARGSDTSGTEKAP